MKLMREGLALVLAAGLVPMLAPAVAQTPPAHPALDPAARAAEFDKADKNKDGQLTKEEWLSALPATVNKDRAEAMWTRMDPDKTGHIGKDAFVNFRGPPRGVGTSSGKPPG